MKEFLRDMWLILSIIIEIWYEKIQIYVYHKVQVWKSNKCKVFLSLFLGISKYKLKPDIL